MGTSQVVVLFLYLCLAEVSPTAPSQSVIFRPDNVEGLCLWLDAADADSISADASARVSQWRDKSAFSNHMEQSRNLRKPRKDTFEHSGSTFDSIRFQDDFLRHSDFSGLDGNTDVTAIVLARPKNNHKTGTVLSSGFTSSYTGWLLSREVRP